MAVHPPGPDLAALDRQDPRHDRPGRRGRRALPGPPPHRQVPRARGLVLPPLHQGARFDRRAARALPPGAPGHDRGEPGRRRRLVRPRGDPLQLRLPAAGVPGPRRVPHPRGGHRRRAVLSGGCRGPGAGRAPALLHRRLPGLQLPAAQGAAPRQAEPARARHARARMDPLRPRPREPARHRRAVDRRAPAAGGDLIGRGDGPAHARAGLAAHRAGAGPGGPGGAGGPRDRRRDARGHGAPAPPVPRARGEGRPRGLDPGRARDDVRALQADQRVPHDLPRLGGRAGGPRPAAARRGRLGGPGEHRRPDRPAEPAPPRRVPLRRRRGGHDRGARPRRVQGGQRHPRAPGGGRDPAAGRGAAVERGAHGRPARAHGRRRVHPGAAGRDGVRRGRGVAADPVGGVERELGVLGAGHARGRLDRVGASDARRQPFADALGCRPGDVPDEAVPEVLLTPPVRARRTWRGGRTRPTRVRGGVRGCRRRRRR